MNYKFKPLSVSFPHGSLKYLCQVQMEVLLTLARKLDSVHRKTVSSRKDIPSVLLAMPARPRPSRKPTAGARPSDVARLTAPCEARLLPRPSDEGITAFLCVFFFFCFGMYGILLSIV